MVFIVKHNAAHTPPMMVLTPEHAHDLGPLLPTHVAHENMLMNVDPHNPCFTTQVAHEIMRPEFQASAPEDYSGLARRCWAQDPLTRPTFQVSPPVCYFRGCVMGRPLQGM
jgi:hypothetical protein